MGRCRYLRANNRPETNKHTRYNQQWRSEFCDDRTYNRLYVSNWEIINIYIYNILVYVQIHIYFAIFHLFPFTSFYFLTSPLHPSPFSHPPFFLSTARMSYDEAIIPLLTRLKRDSLQISNKPANNTTTTNGHMRLWDSQQYGNQWIFDIISKKKTMGIYV